MKTLYLWEIVTATTLVGVVELYFWTQSSTGLQSETMKLFILAVYLAIALGSQYGLLSILKCGIKDALKGNALVALLVSAGVTLLSVLAYRGVAKDIPNQWFSISELSLKFVVTIGLATLLVRMLLAAVILRSAQYRI